MAETAQIARLRLLLGPGVLTDEDLGKVIDLAVPGGETNPDMLEAEALAWETAAARYHALVDTSESGSSRSMSQMHKNAMAMAASVRKRIAERNALLVVEIPVTSRSGTRKITRI